MGRDRGHLGGHDATEPPGPVLRPGEESAGAGESARKLALDVKKLPPEVEASWEVRCERLLERRPQRVVFRIDGGEAVELVVHRRRRDAGVGDENAGGAMGG